jgi:hypothetical protein
MLLIEKDRGFQNPEGMVKGYGRVGVRVQILLPPTNPYPSRGSQGSKELLLQVPQTPATAQYGPWCQYLLIPPPLCMYYVGTIPTIKRGFFNITSIRQFSVTFSARFCSGHPLVCIAQSVAPLCTLINSYRACI